MASCGWCMTNDHENCLPSISWFDKTWLCTCKKCHPTVESESEPKQEKNKDEKKQQQ